uniref:Uncharacterized protein isoform X1 n=1 Tax=Sus scrofa TaxID=9823 RepID=A0A480YDW1_PIG
MGATGQQQYPWTTRRTVDLGVGRVTHSFLVIPECPAPLLGRDLLTKMGAQISFEQGKPEVSTNTSGWPICLKAIAAVAMLVKDADKLTLGQNITVIAPHTLKNIVRQPPDRWMTNAHMTHYQSLLLTERVTFAPPAALNPATLLPEETDKPVTHDYHQLLIEETGVRKDLTDIPLTGKWTSLR